MKDVWGVQVAGGVSSERYGFSQREEDRESGLVHLRARMYDPRIGRLTQIDPILSNRATKHYIYAANNPLKYVDPYGQQEVTVNGWELYGKTDQEVKQLVADKAGKLGQAMALASGKMKVSTTFTSLDPADPERIEKLKWFGSMVKRGLDTAGAKDASKHFDHWLSGKGAEGAPEIPVDSLKSGATYKEFLAQVEKEIKDGKKDGSFTANEYGKDFKLHILMGHWMYKWKVSDDGKSVIINVDDPYDFHFDKDATFRSEVKREYFGKEITFSTFTYVPDALVLQLKDIGAKDFSRKAQWTETVPASPKKKPEEGREPPLR